MLNNIKIEPLNPSKSHIAHKIHLLCHHKVCAHKWQSRYTSTTKYLYIQTHQILSYNTKETFIVPRHAVVGQRRFLSLNLAYWRILYRWKADLAICYTCWYSKIRYIRVKNTGCYIEGVVPQWEQTPYSHQARCGTL